MTDYTKFDSSADMLHALGDDAGKWAEAFLQYHPNADLDESDLISWFANAIEHSFDIRTGRIHNGDHAEYLIDRYGDSDR